MKCSISARGALFALLLGWASPALPAPATDARHAAPAAGDGVWAIWLRNDHPALSTPALLEGAQAWAQWADVEPAPGEYDFSRLEQRLTRLADAGLGATVQINANTHPRWLLDRVPTLDEPLRRTRRQQRTPMYWHPDYLAAQQRLIRALGDWIASTPNGGTIEAVRLNINAIGTEHWRVPREQRSLAAWQTPDGVTAGTAWTRQRGVDYAVDVVQAYLEVFEAAEPLLLVRRGLLQPDGYLQATPRGRRLAARLAQMLADHRIGMFHTSSEIQPRNARYSASSYRTMHHWCRERLARCYAESWTDAKARRTAYPSTPETSPGQWFYWRVLSDLHLGVSMVAVYGDDLYRADDEGFAAGLELARLYAGRHRAPATSPGAWVAFRSGDYVPGDYTFLARAIEGCGRRTSGAGPAGSPEGLWASRMEAGEECLIAVDERFLDAHRGRQLTLEVSVLAQPGRADLALSGLADTRIEVPSGTSWQTLSARFDVPAGGNRIRLTAEGGPLTMHRVSLRGQAVQHRE